MTDRYTLHHGDCIDVMRTMPDASVDAIVTDPPYELGFMGKSWDASGIAFNMDVWREALRVLKPGGHLLAFSGSRTYHRMAVAIEDAGFEIRDQIMWIYGSGFPKSLDVSKAIDKAAGAEREVVGTRVTGAAMTTKTSDASATNFGSGQNEIAVTVPATPAAQQWQGWGTALKPAHEPIVVARKPLTGTVAANVLAHGTGALNIDGTRVPSDDGFEKAWDRPVSTSSANVVLGGLVGEGRKLVDLSANKPTGGRWPANVIHDGSDEVVEHFGDAHRFFYCAKASRRDRDEGLNDTHGKQVGAKGNGLARKCASCGASVLDGCTCPDRTFENPVRKNHHPTVKPTDLMRYLIRLVTPPQGVVLDPFMGSGSTGKAAMLEGNRFIGIEQDGDYLAIAEARIRHALNTPLEDVLFKPDELPDTQIAQLANPGTLFDDEATA